MRTGQPQVCSDALSMVTSAQTVGSAWIGLGNRLVRAASCAWVER
jgi:hypothetical protein